jgi:hypothetical protein
LKDIDWNRHERKISEVWLELGGMCMPTRYSVLFDSEFVTFTIDTLNADKREDTPTVRAALDALHFEYWLPNYPQEGEIRVCGGEQWNLSVSFCDGTILQISGDNCYPENWDSLLRFFGINYEDDETDEHERKPGEVI